MNNPFAGFNQNAPAQAAPAPAQTSPFGAQPVQAAPAPQTAPAPSAPAQAAAQHGFDAPGAPTPPANLSELFASGASGGDGARIKDDEGALVCIRPDEFLEGMRTSLGQSDAIRADWLVLDGPAAGEVRENSLIFNKVLVSGIHASMKRGMKFVVGRIGRGEAKPGQSAPFIIQPPTEQEMQLAVQGATHIGWV